MDSTLSDKTKIYLLFFFSGISGLIYETVWLRILTRVLGSTVYATSVVLAAFMAGLAIGSYVLGRYGDKIKRQLRAYAILELCIGVSAIILLFLFKELVPIYKSIYAMAGGDRFRLTVFQAIILFAILLIPTSLMGGTLPILSSYTKKYKTVFAERLGYLYGVNTLGACLGVLGSGFFFIGTIGETSTVFTGSVINLAVALAAFTISKRNAAIVPMHVERAQISEPIHIQPISQYSDKTRRVVAFSYAVSGFIAMSYEIIWARIFQIHIGTSIYAFSLMLAIYLMGIALGSILEGKITIRIKNPLLLFGAFQLFISLYSIVGMYLFTLFTPIYFAPWLKLSNSFAVLFIIVFPITFVLGMMFPIVSRCYVRNEREVGRGVGLIYSINTFGCIAGSFVCGFIFISLFGSRNTMLVLAAMNFLIGVMLLYMTPAIQRRLIHFAACGFLIILFVLGALAPDPFLSASKKIINTIAAGAKAEAEVYYYKEDALATTCAFGLKDKLLEKHLLFNGMGMTMLCVETKLMAHIPLLLHPDPKDILVICFGMGTTVRSAWAHKSVRCDTVDLVDTAYKCFKYFHSDGPAILADQRVHCYVDDGRNFLLMRPKEYDVINVDPSPPIWSAGTVNLYSREFFQLCKDRLTPQGILCLWIMPSPFSEGAMIMKTFSTVFPNTYVYGGPYYKGLYMVGFKDPAMKPSSERFIKAEKDEAIMADLHEWNMYLIPSPKFLCDLLILNPEELATFVKDMPVVTDDNPYTEFPLWRQRFDETFRWKLDADLLVLYRDVILKKE